jgi:hypothetical protein
LGNLEGLKNGFEPIHQFVEQAAVVGFVVAVISPQAAPVVFSVPVPVVFSPALVVFSVLVVLFSVPAVVFSWKISCYNVGQYAELDVLLDHACQTEIAEQVAHRCSEHFVE